MKRLKLQTWIAVIATAAATTLVVVSTAPAQRERVTSRTKADAERDVLRVVPRLWSHRRIALLIDKRTDLLKNNVQAVCRGRGERYEGGRYRHFVCAVRPFPAGNPQGLLVSYRALPSGRVEVRWIRSRS